MSKVSLTGDHGGGCAAKKLTQRLVGGGIVDEVDLMLPNPLEPLQQLNQACQSLTDGNEDRELPGRHELVADRACDCNLFRIRAVRFLSGRATRMVSVR